MRFFLSLLAVAIVAAAGVEAWRRFYPPAPAPVQVPPPDLSPRVWTNLAGRSFTGAMVTANAGAVVIRRTGDATIFQVPLDTLVEADRDYTSEQVGRAKKLNLRLGPDLYDITRKLEIKGSLLRIPASAGEGGFRMSRVDPMYWLLLSPPLAGDAPAFWLRVDEKTFRAHAEKTLLAGDDLTNFLDSHGKFANALPWPRTRVTIREAKYGVNHADPDGSRLPARDPNAGLANVTFPLMKLVSEGKLPIAINASLLGLADDDGSGELTVLWQTPSGEARQVLRSGSVLTWP